MIATMLGAICGDVIGAPYEVNAVTFLDFEIQPDNARMTDDTVCTCAVASWILRGSSLDTELRAWATSSRNVPFGAMFEDWVYSAPGDVGRSAGNGACMRVSAIAGLSSTLEEALDRAGRSVMNSHFHPDSVTAAQSVVAAAFLGLCGWERELAFCLVQTGFGYFPQIDRPLELTRPDYGFRTLASETAPVALRAAREGRDFEHVLRLAISMGGDADTLAATACGVAGAWFPVPEEISGHVMPLLPNPVRQVLAAHDRRAAETVRTPPASPEDAERIMKAANARWRKAAGERRGLLAAVTGFLRRAG